MNRRAPSDRRRRHALLALALSLATLLVVGAGFAGSFVRPLDSLSHFRLHLGAAALALMLASIAGRFHASAAIAALAAVFAAAGSVPFLLAPNGAPAEGEARYTLLQMNLRWNAEDHAGALRRIADVAPDVIALQEMTPRWRATLAPLAERYPFQVHCPGADGFRGDSALLSRRPFVEGAPTICDERNSLASARIDFNGTSVTIVSHHQLWPWPYGQWRRLERIEPTLEAFAPPVIIAGDFNAAPWSALLARYAAVSQTRVVRGVGPSWFPEILPAETGRWLGLPIDNVLASPPIGVQSVRRLEATASDHLPVLIGFTIERPAGGGERETTVVEALSP